jgi:hypothetical protein
MISEKAALIKIMAWVRQAKDYRMDVSEKELLKKWSELREDLREDLREGISLRDHFAGLAMQELMAADVRVVWDNESIAKLAYDQADAMLEEREKNDN